MPSYSAAIHRCSIGGGMSLSDWRKAFRRANAHRVPPPNAISVGREENEWYDIHVSDGVEILIDCSAIRCLITYESMGSSMSVHHIHIYSAGQQCHRSKSDHTALTLGMKWGSGLCSCSFSLHNRSSFAMKNYPSVCLTKQEERERTPRVAMLIQRTHPSESESSRS